MLKTILITMMLMLVSISALAEFVGPGAISTLTDVRSVAKLREDSRVSLVGNLINQLDVEYFTFKDGTGQMVVEINPNDLIGITVTPETKIKIYGEVDDGDYNSKVDVGSIEILD